MNFRRGRGVQPRQLLPEAGEAGEMPVRPGGSGAAGRAAGQPGHSQGAARRGAAQARPRGPRGRTIAQ